MPQEHLKDPDAVLDYSLDWSAWLDTDTISASTWTVPDGITVDSDSVIATTTTVWLSGGTVGQAYAVTNTVVTAAARTDERTLTIYVVEK